MLNETKRGKETKFQKTKEISQKLPKEEVKDTNKQLNNSERGVS